MRSFNIVSVLANLALALASTAAAQTKVPTINCQDATARPRVVYVTGSSAVRPFLGPVAKLMAADPTPYTLIYQSQGSCVGVDAIYSTDPAKRLIKDVPAVGSKASNYAIAFAADGTAQECFLNPAGNTVDVGISDVFASSCNYTVPPAGIDIIDYQGPIQPMTLVVPAASTQQSISAEAGYYAFGLGGNNGDAAPWTDPKLYFVRNSSSGTQQMIARAVDVPAAKWWGVDRGGSSVVVSNMEVIFDQATAEKAIGILSTDLADVERNRLRILAFQAKGQKCGYWPDSSKNSFDKLNVREGRYVIWGPLHFYSRVEGGIPTSAAASVVSRFAVLRPEKDLVDAIIEKHLVPQCAMRVVRTTEMGPLQSKAPEFQCGCYFDFKSNGASTCKTCNGPGDCPAERPACNYGYCETK